MKQNLKDFLFNLGISMLIGLFVGIVQMTVKNMNVKIVEELIIFSIIGGVIGTISRFLFIYIVAIKQKSAMAGFVCIFMVIGGISCMPFLYYYFIYNISAPMIDLISVLITAELLGMSFCYYSHKRCLELNSKLLSKKKQLSGKS